jgi:hypothetical protein
MQHHYIPNTQRLSTQRVDPPRPSSNLLTLQPAGARSPRAPRNDNSYSVPAGTSHSLSNSSEVCLAIRS